MAQTESTGLADVRTGSTAPLHPSDRPATNPHRDTGSFTSTPAAPSNTGSVTYTPAPGDPDITVAFGKTFHAGKSVSIDDPKLFAKLRGHPNFSDGKRPAEVKDADAEALDKEREKATEEAQEARKAATEATAEAEAKERAKQALNNLRSAEKDPDRKPPVTNVPSNR